MSKQRKNFMSYEFLVQEEETNTIDAFEKVLIKSQPVEYN